MTAPFIPQPGMIGLTQIGGDVGKGIRIGQFLNGNGFSTYEHAFLYLGNGKLLEAEPGGARIADLSEYPADSVYFCWNLWALVRPPLLNEAYINRQAQKYVGVKYSFLDYDALAAHRLHIPAPGLRRYISDTSHLICSQLVDEFYHTDLDVTILTGEWPGYVTPGAIWQRDLRLKP
jgi:hypothetical protein